MRIAMVLSDGEKKKGGREGRSAEERGDEMGRHWSRERSAGLPVAMIGYQLQY